MVLSVPSLPGEFTQPFVHFYALAGTRAALPAAWRRRHPIAFPSPTDIGISLPSVSLRGSWWWWWWITVHISVSITLRSDRKAASFAAAQPVPTFTFSSEFVFIFLVVTAEEERANASRGFFPVENCSVTYDDSADRPPTVCSRSYFCSPSVQLQLLPPAPPPPGPPPPPTECPLAKKLSYFLPPPPPQQTCNECGAAFGAWSLSQNEPPDHKQVRKLSVVTVAGEKSQRRFMAFMKPKPICTCCIQVLTIALLSILVDTACRS